jgi:DNA-binding CsgD family transcriptional regulator
MLNKENNLKVSELLKQNLTEEQIAKRLNMTIKEVIDIVDLLSRK